MGSGPQPGWYTDPVDDFELRWFDGARWTSEVATGPWTGRWDLPVATEPLVPPHEVVVWSDGTQTISSHRLVLREPLRAGPVMLPVWSVRATRCRAPHRVRGDVELTIAYPGYTGRTTWLVRDVLDAPRVGALTRMWASRNRRSGA